MSTTSERGEELANNVQANLLRVSKFADGQTRNWSLFLFFRILTKAEMDETKKRLDIGDAKLDGAANKAASLRAPNLAAENLKALKLDLTQPSLTQAGVTASASESKVDDAAKTFRAWIDLIVNRQADNLLDALIAMAPQTASSPGPSSHKGFGVEQHDDVLRFFKIVRDLQGELKSGPKDGATSFENLRKQAWERLHAVAEKPEDNLLLPRLLFYELLRQAEPAFKTGAAPQPEGAAMLAAIVHGEATVGESREKDATIASLPINIAFTYSGLKALGVHGGALASFPDAFRQGMAARARRLGDVGRSAPEHWEGELGQASIHGYFTGGFDARELHASTDFWRRLRAEIRAFNDATDKAAPANASGQGDVIGLREQVQTMFRIAGMELLHVELGQDPSQEENDRSSDPEQSPRREHFGFRDGLSQPFVNLKLGDTLPGGGAPGRRGGWTPVAPGEIFLSAADEDSEIQATPVNGVLREGSTYLVFRKLEQDVAGLRSFIARQHPGDKAAQKTLTAQLVGRWPDGAPLVLSPYENTPPPGQGEAPLNDFRYAEHDPNGRLCPLGAHIRRANPRDTGGRDEVRHHRILRRGISYGGPMLPKDSMGDGEPRGLLFVAANARIDLQFEVIQAEWLNGGEFLGQAGLGRCPLTGSNAGATADRFLARGAIAPVTGLPSFVTLRGGDYFFAPGVTALRKIADGVYDFEPDPERLNGFAMGDVKTPALFDEGRLGGLAKRLVTGQRRAIVLAAARSETQVPPERIAFVGQHADVVEVLSNKKDGNSIAFSVSPYLKTGRAITRGHDLLIGTEDDGSTGDVRKRMFTILDTAWRVLAGWQKDDPSPVKPLECRIERLPDDYKLGHTALDKIVEARLGMALRSVAGVRRLDLIEDFASQAAYGVTCEVLGLPGPNWVTEMAPALAYSKQHVGALPTDWLTALNGQLPADPGFTTMRLWTSILVADLIGNVEGNSDLKALSRQAGSELLNHIDLLTLDMRDTLTRDPRAFLAGSHKTLLAAFVALEGNPALADVYEAFATNGAVWQDRYYQDVAMILLEIAGSTLAVIPLTFSHVMEQLFDKRIDLSWLLGAVSSKMPLSRIIYEAERLNPNMPVRMRACQRDSVLTGGLGGAATDTIKTGDAVVALIAAANMDPRVFHDQTRFHLQDANVCPMRLVGAELGRATTNAKAGTEAISIEAETMTEALNPWGKPMRSDKDYLLFGVQGSQKYCWGANKVAMPVLEVCLAQAGRLQGLRRVAGPRGEPQKLAGVTIGLQARFSRVLEKSPCRSETEASCSAGDAGEDISFPQISRIDNKVPSVP